MENKYFSRACGKGSESLSWEDSYHVLINILQRGDSKNKQSLKVFTSDVANE